ncbi:glycosyltransferase family 87 protein [Amycolatopsis pigmentata]|uniref:Glycosyltransferase family 87 protein n=1 Tax=Amycolatopsis pigmentata TaxID=450801 RepID=A0ABW5FVU9_9PSEU
MSSPTERAVSDSAPASLEEGRRVLPSRTEPLVAAVTAPLGGPIGDHAAVGRHWFFSPQRVGLLLATLALMLCWFGKASCIQQYTDETGHNQLDWRAGRPYVAMCYTDLVPLYTAERLNLPDTVPYRTTWVENADTPNAQQHYMEYPVLSGFFQWTVAKIARVWTAVSDAGWLPGALPVAVYFDIAAFWLSAAWLVTVWAVGRTANRRPWDAALAAISPLVLVHAFTNFDTIATAFAATGILAWARRRPVLAGVLIGLGAAAKPYPLFFLGPLLVLCIRAGKVRTWALTAGAAVATWLAVNLPVAFAFTPGWREYFLLNAQRGMDPDSLYNVVSYFTGWAGFDGAVPQGQTPSVLNLVTAALFLLCCAGIAYIGFTAPRRPRLPQLCFLVVAAFLLTGKVWSPQYSLWLVPLAVLAIPRWRPLLAWMLVDALVWVPRMFYYLGVSHKGLPEDWFLGFVVVRDLAVAALCFQVIREIYRPGHDLVRLAGDDDPAGGVLDGALDAAALKRRQPAMAS